ncbi:MAG TPA: MFS transporter [Gemmatimonadaceae bacterium]|nr:MFS transporter [Gemmatimonadaceae bacterium]
MTLGLAANWPQFTLLVVVNAFVGAMVGLERSVLPIVAGRDFGVASATAALAFIGAFGLAKALTNLAAGALVESHGRRFVLIVGWLVALPVPVIVLTAPSWWWIVAANTLLGVNQGLAWSATVIMKIDLVGPRRRGLAMGLNEFAGYFAVALAAFGSGMVATSLGLRAGPAYVGLAIATAGLALSVFFVRETAGHATHEETTHAPTAEIRPTAWQLVRRSLWSDRAMFSVSQAGLVNNLNDGLAWGIFPLLFAGAALSLTRMSALVAIYPAVWGISQLVTGPLSDRWGRKWMIVVGMIVQGLALLALAWTHAILAWVLALVTLGIGTALVYPTLLAAVGDIARPSWRGLAVGVYRFWRDIGYVVGALLAGVLADTFGVPAAVSVIGILTIASGLLVAARFRDARPLPQRHSSHTREDR